MADASTNPPDPRPCDVCSAIPQNQVANTGRGDSLSPLADQLVRLGLDSGNDISVCPVCETLFEWEDLPQTYGSGNNDEERLTRLSPTQAATARELLDPAPGERDAKELIERAFRTLSHGIVYVILDYRAARHEPAFSALVGPLVDRLLAENHGSLSAVLMSYCGMDREQLSTVVRLLDASGRELNSSARHLRSTCVERLEP